MYLTIQLACARRPFVLLRKAIAGPRRETESEGGGLSAERTLIKNSPSILYHQKIEIAFNFIREIPLHMNETKVLHRVPFLLEIPLSWNRVQFYKRNPCKIYKRITCKIYRDFFCKYITFRLIFKKSYQQGVFEFSHPDPQLVQIFKPTRNLPGHFLYIYTSVYK